MINKLLPLLVLAALGSCGPTPSEKRQTNRNSITDVQGCLREIKTDPLFFNNYSSLYLLNDYLLICDHKSYDDQIYLFHKNDFTFVASTAPKGEGPGEISNIGWIATDESQDRFYVTDHGKQKIYCYEVDSVLTNPNYRPEVTLHINETEFPLRYQYISDTLSIGTVMQPTGHYGFNLLSARWNMTTGEIRPMPDFHPEIKRKRYHIAVSVAYGLCVESYQRHDLLTLRTLSGALKYDIYGPHWEISTQKKIRYFEKVLFCKDKIVVLYSGKDAFTKDEHGDPVSLYPDKIMVFNLEGKYLKTLDVGSPIADFCYDETNNRLILHMTEERQFGYLELEGLIV